MAVLKSIGDPATAFPLLGDTITIGRGGANSIPLADNACSSRHAQFIRDAEGWNIQDRGSLNGTFVNGQRIQPAENVRLLPGDRIMVGATEFLLELETPRAAGPIASRAASESAVLDPASGANYAGSFMQSMADDGRTGRPIGADLQQSLIIDDGADDASGSHFEFRSVDPMPLGSEQTLQLGGSRRRDPSAGLGAIGQPSGERLAEIKLRLLLDVSEKLVQILEPRKLLDEILTIVMDQAGADRGMLCLLDDQRQPTPIAVRGLANDQTVRISRTVLHRVLDRRSGVLIQQASNSANLLRSLEEMQVCSTLCASVVDGGQDRRTAVVGFDAADQNLQRRRFGIAACRGPSGGDGHRAHPPRPGDRGRALGEDLFEQVSRQPDRRADCRKRGGRRSAGAGGKSRDGAVFRHRVVHENLRGPGAGRSGDVHSRILVVDDGCRVCARRHDRQIHRRCLDGAVRGAAAQPE